MDKQFILSKLSSEKTYLEQKYSVDKIGLFGSYAKDTQTVNSDIDIYVEFKNKTFKNLAGLWVYLEEIYHKRIDLVHLHKRAKGAIFTAIQKEVIYG